MAVGSSHRDECRGERDEPETRTQPVPSPPATEKRDGVRVREIDRAGKAAVGGFVEQQRDRDDARGRARCQRARRRARRHPGGYGGHERRAPEREHQGARATRVTGEPAAQLGRRQRVPERDEDDGDDQHRAGKEPEQDIAIEFVGAKPGEKLHEVLWNEGEAVGPTSHAKILRAARAPIDPEWLEDELVELDQMVARGETLDVVSKLATLMREPRRVGSAVLEDTLH